MTLEEFTKKVEAAPQLDFGYIFSRSLELFKEVWLQGLLMIVLQFAAFLGVYVVLMIPLMATGFLMDGQQIEGEEALSVLLLIGLFLLYLFIIIGVSILNIGMQAAFYRIVRIKDRGKNAELGINFGMFFKKRYLKKLVIFSLSITGIGVLAYILCILPIFYVIVPLQFAVLIFAFFPDWTINDTLKAAFLLGNKKWGITFGLLFVSALCAYIVGLVACLIGVYITISFVLLPGYMVYKDVIGFTEDEDLIAQIGA